MKDIHQAKLRPCPFCGRQAIIVRHPGNWNVRPPYQKGGMHGTWYVGCSYPFFEEIDDDPSCEVAPAAKWYANLEMAIKAWNKKP